MYRRRVELLLNLKNPFYDLVQMVKFQFHLQLFHKKLYHFDVADPSDILSLAQVKLNDGVPGQPLGSVVIVSFFHQARWV